MNRLKQGLTKHPLLGGLFLLAAAITLVFLIRAAIFFVVWSDPDSRHQPIEPWMTPRFVSRSWDIPWDDMIDLTGLAPDGTKLKRRTLEDIAAQEDIPVADLIARIETYLADRAERPQ